MVHPLTESTMLSLYKKTRVKQIFKENLQSKRIMLLLIDVMCMEKACVTAQVCLSTGSKDHIQAIRLAWPIVFNY